MTGRVADLLMVVLGWLLESSYVLCLVGCSVCAACMRYCTW